MVFLVFHIMSYSTLKYSKFSTYTQLNWTVLVLVRPHRRQSTKTSSIRDLRGNQIYFSPIALVEHRYNGGGGGGFWQSLFQTVYQISLVEGFRFAEKTTVQYFSRNMHTVFALLCFVVVIHWLIFPYPSGLFHWHCGNLTIAPGPVKQPWWIWINTSCEFIMNDCITTTEQSTTKPCAYFLGYTVNHTQTWSTVLDNFLIHRASFYIGPLLLTLVNFNPSMYK